MTARDITGFRGFAPHQLWRRCAGATGPWPAMTIRTTTPMIPRPRPSSARLAAARSHHGQSRADSGPPPRLPGTPRFTAEKLFEEFFGICRAGPLLASPPGPIFATTWKSPWPPPYAARKRSSGGPPRLICHPCRGTGLAPGSAYHDCPQCQGRGRRFGGRGCCASGRYASAAGGGGKSSASSLPALRRGRRTWQRNTACGFLRARRRHPPAYGGEGGEGFQKRPPGNLEVVIHVAPDDFFTRVGNDIHCQVKVSFAEAARGGAVRVPTLDGYQTVQLPQGTRNRLGLAVSGSRRPGDPHQPPGDQVIEIVVTTRQDFSPSRKSCWGSWIAWGRAVRPGQAMSSFTHLDETGQLRMVDVGDKAETAPGHRWLAGSWWAPRSFPCSRPAAFPKGDVWAAAGLAGIMAAKNTAQLIPLCHTLPLTGVEIDFTPEPGARGRWSSRPGSGPRPAPGWRWRP